MSNAQKKRIAKNLYLKGENPKAIAELLDVNDKTVNNWINENNGKWKKQRERLQDITSHAMLITANLYFKAYELSSDPSQINIEEINRYALAIERFTPAKDDFAIITEVGKSLTLFLVEQQIPREDINKFIHLYKNFARWYLKVDQAPYENPFQNTFKSLATER